MKITLDFDEYKQQLVKAEIDGYNRALKELDGNIHIEGAQALAENLLKRCNSSKDGAITLIDVMYGLEEYIQGVMGGNDYD